MFEGRATRLHFNHISFLQRVHLCPFKLPDILLVHCDNPNRADKPTVYNPPLTTVQEGEYKFFKLIFTNFTPIWAMAANTHSIVNIIQKKRDGGTLTDEESRFFIHALVNKQIDPAQTGPALYSTRFSSLAKKFDGSSRRVAYGLLYTRA
jgi:hypothetical protein